MPSCSAGRPIAPPALARQIWQLWGRPFVFLRGEARVDASVHRYSLECHKSLTVLRNSVWKVWNASFHSTCACSLSSMLATQDAAGSPDGSSMPHAASPACRTPLQCCIIRCYIMKEQVYPCGIWAAMTYSRADPDASPSQLPYDAAPRFPLHACIYIDRHLSGPMRCHSVPDVRGWRPGSARHVSSATVRLAICTLLVTRDTSYWIALHCVGDRCPAGSMQGYPH